MNLISENASSFTLVRDPELAKNINICSEAGPILTFKSNGQLEVNIDDPNEAAKICIDRMKELWLLNMGSTKTIRSNQVPQDFIEAILHGDEKHRAWLQAAADAYNAGLPIPDVN